MAVKSTKEKKTATPKNGVVKAEKSKSSKKKVDEDEEDEDLDVEEEDANASDDVDDWGKAEDDSWDPDFAEFDLPKPTKKAGKAKKGEEEEDLDLDLNLDDDDLFDDKDEFDDDF
ncbi:MAG: hypothetical protein KA534_04940 [Sediminibacterium sp.]|nr:hypothetical protein [Sediminibacterium sp.]